MTSEADIDSFPKASLAGFLFTALIIISFSVILVPESDRSEWFWTRVAWAEFLACCIWVFLGGFFVHSSAAANTGTFGGMLPSFGVVVFAYSATSLSLMLTHAWFETLLSVTAHFIAQGVILGVAGIVSVLLAIAIKTGDSGTEKIPFTVESVAELIALLTLQADRFSPAEMGPEIPKVTRGLWESIRALTERLRHSIPHVGRIGQAQQYHDLVAESLELFDDLERVDPLTDDHELLGALTTRVRGITNGFTLLAASLKR